jgi:predicted HAD superfamily Cof-like phosphohydrolase
MQLNIQAVRTFMAAANQPERNFESAKLYAEVITPEEYRERTDVWQLIKANPLEKRHHIEHLDGIIDSIWCLIAEGLAMGYDVEGAFNEVARSNLSKIMSNGKIEKAPTGKVMKPDTYSPPQLEPFI